MRCFIKTAQSDPNWKTSIKLDRESHIKYLKSGLAGLGSGFQSLDASKPWLCYWILHGLDLLDYSLDDTTKSKLVNYLKQCADPAGGLCGGPGQLPHLAPTYAGINALLICATEEAYQSIDRKALYQFFLKLKIPGGGFRVHENGEADVRGSYCALSVAYVLNLLTEELTEGVAKWIASCQTYEGGIGGDVGNEAHGGYTFCGFAALCLLQSTHLLDRKAFLKWVVHRQMAFEGGFQGRTNKLVDGCYSFWQGGLFALLDSAFFKNKDKKGSEGGWMFNQLALQEYVLACCQADNGGLVDKPKKGRDFYHTCYCLSGLSVAQHNPEYLPEEQRDLVLGVSGNLLKEIDPLHNVSLKSVLKAKAYFEKLQAPPFD
uniref:Protein farnesyltransferase subunit beta n=1 Tax=Arcella intermedia TaxID=1963864 RepID=A0A6B2L6D9_9EUKA